jgi:hypothetical protein
MVKRVRVRSGLTTLSPSDKMEKVKQVVAAMTNNKNFTTPVPALQDISAAITELGEAHVAFLGGGNGLAENVREKEIKLILLVNQLASYVEIECKGSEAVAASSGLEVISSRPRAPKVFAANNGDLKGQVDLTAPRVSSASYVWQFCKGVLPAEPAVVNGSTWSELIPSSVASLTVHDLVPLETYWFRFATVTRKGQGNWSEPISILVL